MQICDKWYEGDMLNTDIFPSKKKKKLVEAMEFQLHYFKS